MKRIINSVLIGLMLTTLCCCKKKEISYYPNKAVVLDLTTKNDKT